MSHNISDRFAHEVKYSHQVVSKAELWIDNRHEQDLIISDGNVRITDKEIRRRADIAVLDPNYELVPTGMLDRLAPAGNEIHLYRGLRFADKTEELLQLGTFTIDDVRVDESGDGHQLRLDCFDRGRRMERARFVDDYTISAGALVVEAIQDMILEVLPDVHFHIDPAIDDTTNARFYESGKDRWAAARSLATNIGAEVFFNEHGGCVIRYVETAVHYEDPAWEFDTRTDEHLLLYINKRLHNSDTYNHVIVSGESSSGSVPVRAEAMDNNPASPTYVYGKYGMVTHHHKSSQIETQTQAQQVADALLAKGLGGTETIDITNIVLPQLDVGDAIYVNEAKSRTSALYTIDSITIPMTSVRGMNLSCRERRVT